MKYFFWCKIILSSHSPQDYSVSQTTLDDVFIHFASEQREDIGVNRAHKPHPSADNPEMGVSAGSSSDHLPDIVPPGNGSRKLSTTGGIIRYTKLREDIDIDDENHEP